MEVDSILNRGLEIVDFLLLLFFKNVLEEVELGEFLNRKNPSSKPHPKKIKI